MTKLEALAKHLEIDASDIEAHCSNDCNTFTVGREEYLVFTDTEADTAASEAIQSSLWAFNAEFIASHTKNGLTLETIKALETMQRDLCENCHPIVEALIDDMDHFISDAIAADGRGHFLSSYDGEENNEGPFFIYRTN